MSQRLAFIIVISYEYISRAIPFYGGNWTQVLFTDNIFFCFQGDNTFQSFNLN